MHTEAVPLTTAPPTPLPGAAATRARCARSGRGASGAPSSMRGSGTSAVATTSACSRSWAEGSGPGCASARAAPTALVPVVITSPATRAPHIGQAISLLGRLKRQIRYARFPGRRALDGKQGGDREVCQLGPAVQEGELEQ